MKKVMQSMAGLLVVALLGGCSALQTVGKTNDEIVAQRAEARWRALIEGDLEGAYEYLSPAYRKLHSFARYRGRIKGVGVWRDVKIESVNCEQESCKVGALVSASFMHTRMTKPLDTQELMTEGWIYDKASRNWYFVPK